MSRLTGFGLLVTLLSAGCSSFTAADAKIRLEFQVGTDATPIDMETLQAVKIVVEKRLQLSEFKSQFVVETKSPNQLIVLAPDLTPDQIAAIRGIVTRPGTLEFALVANRNEHSELIMQAEGAAEPVSDSGHKMAWFPVATDAEGKPRDVGDGGSLVLRESEHDGNIVRELLVALEGNPKMRATDEYLVEASKTSVQDMDTPALGIRLNQRGGYFMHHLTDHNQTSTGEFKRLAVILDGSVYSAPTINAAIGSDSVITGDFAPREVDDLVIALNGGRLSAPVRFVKSRTVEKKE